MFFRLTTLGSRALLQIALQIFTQSSGEDKSLEEINHVFLCVLLHCHARKDIDFWFDMIFPMLTNGEQGQVLKVVLNERRVSEGQP
jgi:hypothetical protein